jgi:asparagine synthetase related protein
MKLFLGNNVFYPWTIDGENGFRGYFIYNGKLYRQVEALHFILDKIDESNNIAILKTMSGVYSFIIKKGNYIISSVDRLRGLPLFYSIIESEFYIGDDVESLRSEIKDIEISNDSVDDMLSSDTFVLGQYTLFNNLYQIRAGEVCVFDEHSNTFYNKQYYTTNHDYLYDDNEEVKLKEQFWLAYKRTGEDMIKALRNRTAVIPLSGGADSRMILDLLIQGGYKKIICYTYGKFGNKEAEISRKVAKKNGCKWYFIPYTPQMWEHIRDSKERFRYENYAASFTSTPHFQDYPAVKFLKEKHLIPSDAVFIPGHSGDIPNGNHVAKVYTQPQVTDKECLNSILNFTYHRVKSSTLKRLKKYYPILENGSPQDYATIEEWFDTAERQAKYIVNSVRVYEFFGYEWLIPLWDNNQLDFWSHISLRWRYGRCLYYKMTQGDNIPSTNDPSLRKTIENKIRKTPVLRSIVRRITKMKYWKSSNLYMEHLLDKKDYMKACLLEYQSFSVVTLICKNYVNRLISEYGKAK